MFLLRKVPMYHAHLGPIASWLHPNCPQNTLCAKPSPGLAQIRFLSLQTICSLERVRSSLGVTAYVLDGAQLFQRPVPRIGRVLFPLAPARRGCTQGQCQKVTWKKHFQSSNVDSYS